MLLRLVAVFTATLFVVASFLPASFGQGTSTQIAQTVPTTLSQREDSSVIMPVGHADANDNNNGNGNGSSLTWKVDLKHAGAYVLQLVLDLEQAKGDVSAELSVDGVEHQGSLVKNYIIEDGLVAGFEQPIDLSKTEISNDGLIQLTVTSDAAIKYARLVPAGYVKSRIQLASLKYYSQWLKMHQSPEKVTAMKWYQEARFGMFIHWGVYSHAAGEWKGKRIEEGKGPKVAEWIMNAFEVPRAEYRDFAKSFKPEPTFAANIAKLAKDTGMKYVVITSKHHDGFGLFDSAHSKFDIADATNYKGDLIKELYDACRAQGLEFGVYYSHGNDWSEGGDGNYANVRKRDQQYGVATRPNGKNLWDPSPDSHQNYLTNKAYPQVAELIRMLPELRLIWFDGEGLITEAQAFEMYKMVYDLNPNIIVNRRIGYDFGDYVDAGDNKTPTANELAAKHFETCGTANHSWGFKQHDDHWKTPHQLLRNFVDIVSKGGNYLLNIGPKSTGAVPQPCVDSFLEMGQWVNTNADAIYGTERWQVFNEGVAKRSKKRGQPAPQPKPTEFWFSAKGNKVYAMSLAPAEKQARVLSMNTAAGKIVQLRLLGSDTQPKWSQTESALEVDFDGVTTGQNGYVIEATFGN